MITLSSYPEAGENKKYLAVNNPLIYKFHAEGKGGGGYYSYLYDATSIGSVDGKQIIVAGDRTNTIRPGDIINISDIYIRNIVSVNYVSVDKLTYIIIDSSVTASPTGTIKSINNYRAEFRVFHGKKDTTTSGELINSQVGVKFELTPDSSGLIEFDAKPFLKSFVDFRTLLSVTKKNTPDLGVWGRFYLEYRERFEGDGKDLDTGWVTTELRWWVSAVRQLRTRFGVSMLPEINSDPFITGTPEPLGQFLTSFQEPEYYVGYPNEVSFAWVEYPGFEYLTFKEETLGPSKTVTSTTQTELATEGIQEINRVKVNNYTSANYVRVSIDTTEDPTENYVESDYVQELYIETI